MWKNCLYVVGAAAVTAFAVSFLLYDQNTYTLEQIEYQGQADVLIYQGKMTSFMMACDSTGIEPKACLQGWVMRGGD